MSFVRRADKGVAELEAEIAALEAGQGQPPVEAPKAPEAAPVAKEPETDSKDPFEKRYANLRSHSAKKENELKKRIEDLEAQLRNGPAKLPTNAEEVKAWIAKYPQVAGIVRAIAKEEAAGKVAPINSQVEELETMRADLERERGEAKIVKAHPDFYEITADDAFHDWVENQSKAIQTSVYEGDVEDTIAILSLYKRVAGIKPVNPQREAADFIKKGGSVRPSDDKTKGAWSESRVSKMSAAEFEKHEDKIMDAMRDGTFLYDLSGGAR